MRKFRIQVEEYKQSAKEPPHTLFKYYNFPSSIFHVPENRDYSKYSAMVQRRGGRNYYVPFGWVRFGLKLADPSAVFSGNSTCVGFYTADIEMILNICTKGRFPEDEFKSVGAPVQYVYLTPYIDHLEFSGRPCEVPRDLRLNIGGNTRYRVALQCRVPNHLIVEVPDPSPYFSQSIRENAVWRVPESHVVPYAICLKEIT